MGRFIPVRSYSVETGKPAHKPVRGGFRVQINAQAPDYSAWFAAYIGSAGFAVWFYTCMNSPVWCVRAKRRNLVEEI